MDRYQHAKADGTPNWTVGQEHFAAGWAPVRDELRFHQGEGYRLSLPKDKPGKVLKLSEVPTRVLTHLEREDPDTTIRITAQSDGFDMLMRRHAEVRLTADLVIDWFIRHQGLAYVWGVSDCSGTVRAAVLEATGIYLGGNSETMRQNPLMRPIPLGDVEPGDFGFADWDGSRIHHIFVFGDRDPRYPGSIVHDTEPSNTGGPAGWPTTNLGTGVQVRPFFGGYYCHEFFHSAARMVAINGNPK